MTAGRNTSTVLAADEKGLLVANDDMVGLGRRLAAISIAKVHTEARLPVDGCHNLVNTPILTHHVPFCFINGLAHILRLIVGKGCFVVPNLHNAQHKIYALHVAVQNGLLTCHTDWGFPSSNPPPPPPNTHTLGKLQHMQAEHELPDYLAHLLLAF